MAIRPPPDYVKYTRTAAWLRLGKIAVISVLAGLAVAVGMALPDDGKAAEAQGVSVRAGYSYTRMICQEWGQQPRWYNVRDPIAGSDWRNDGGWAIVLERGTTTVDTRAYTFTDNLVETFGPAYEQLRFRDSMGGLDLGSKIYTDTSGGTFNGWSGRAQLNGDRSESSLIWIDANGDGVINAADKIYGDGNNRWRNLLLNTTGSAALVVSSRYIRWANMRWCR